MTTAKAVKIESHGGTLRDDVNAHLERVLAAPEFVASERMSAFLSFVVNETLEGRNDRIKQFTIATKVFQRDSDFDQQNDPIVRVQAAKIRRALQRYYLEEGRDDSIRIEIPKGSYVPTFIAHAAAQKPDRSSVPRSVRPPRVAVMPFSNQSGDASQDYLAMGFAEDLSTELSRFPGVAVVAFYTTQQFAISDADVSELGRRLDADYLLTGSIREVEPTLRMSVQLSRTSDGTQLWGERINKELTTSGLHEAQDEILHCVLARAAGRYGAIHEARSPATRRVDHASLSGYEAVLRSLYCDKTLDPADYADALNSLEAAAKAEPNSAVVLARLAILYLDSYAFGMDAVEKALARGIKQAERALALDRNSQDALYASAWACLLQRDIGGVLKAARRMVELSPGEAYLAGAGGWFLAMAGEREEGISIIKRSQSLNPRCPTWFHFVPFLEHFENGDYEAALTEAKLLGIPNLFWDPLIKAATLGQLGRVDEARSFLDRLLALRPDFPERAAEYVGIFITSDPLRDRILEGLEVAGLEHAA